MLVELFWALLVAGVSAMAVLWVFSARMAFDFLRAAPAAERNPGRWLLVPFWPFALSGLAGGEAERLKFQKLLIGLFAAFLVTASSAAVYSNLTFVPPAQTNQ
ncbi:hypothetical protein MWN34_12140 [Ancylobacter sp. 6x-1]|uniref:Uncharacterized protein n=1 Tax=Ancylobacter crimeensis TaxID=2579147 RepID=A0ABT0DCH4_9HYPH|nr:hypothetical protein [Ancylobacter crimeensis]MCK0197663.1 hypothetical protein [Ancylobacter crimeensis]